MNWKICINVFIALITTCLSAALAQSSKTLRGAVVQYGTKGRVEQVGIRNSSSGKVTYSDKLGLFAIICQIGDTLQIDRIGYQFQALPIQSFSDLVVRLKPALQLNEVNITGNLASQNFKEISAAYSKEKGIFYGGKPSLAMLLPIGGHPITFFYELLGKDGRRVKRLNQLAAQAYEAEQIDRRFNDTVIRQAVAIDSSNIEAFKLKYTPKLKQLEKWSDYELAIYISSSFEEFTNQDLRTP